jgi:hypothetical protein
MLADRLRPAAETVTSVVDDVLHPVSAGTPGRRPRRRRRPGGALPNLYHLRPEARTTTVREIGLLAIPVDEIVGSAVDGPAQRGPDFLPLRPLRSANWKARWQRIRAAVDRLQALPPIEVLQTSDGYWVVDGHNRVAAAKVVGQVAIDAVVRAVQLPGEPRLRPSGSLAAVLEGSDQLRAAGRGLLTPGATLDPVGHAHDRVPRSTDGAGSGRPEPPE